MLDVNLGDGETVYPVAKKLGTLGVSYLFGTGDVQVSAVNGYRQRPLLQKPYTEADVARALVALCG